MSSPRAEPAGSRTSLWDRLGYPGSGLCDRCELPEPELMRGPRFVTLLVTWRCNSRCRLCSVPLRKGVRELDKGEWLRVIRELDDLGSTDLIVSGGEPLLRDDIIELLEEINRRQIAATCALCTNATLIDREMARRIAGCGIRCRIVVSLDGPDAETHDAIRGMPGSFARAVRGIRHLVEAFGGGEHIGVNTILNRYNFRKIRETLGVIHEIGAATVRLAPAYPDSAAPDAILDRRQMIELISDAESTADHGRSLGLNVINLVPFATATMSACFIPWLCMAIDPEGNVAPCNTALGCYGASSNGHRIGNVRDRSLGDLWGAPEYVEFRQGARSREHAVCGLRHCGDVTLQAMNYIRGPCRSCRTGAEFAYPFKHGSESGLGDAPDRAIEEPGGESVRRVSATTPGGHHGPEIPTL